MYRDEDNEVTIRYFDPLDVDDDAVKYQIDCGGILDKLGIARHDETTTREETRITNLNLACSVEMTEFRGAVIMPLYGPDLYSYRKLNPTELDTLLHSMYDCITDAVTRRLCIYDLKPENILTGKENNTTTFIMADMDDIGAAHTRGDYSTYCLPEFGTDGTLQMLFQVMLVAAYCSRALSTTGMMMFFNGDVHKTNATRADIIKCVPAEFHHYIDTIGKCPVMKSLALLRVAIVSEPYKQWRM